MIHAKKALAWGKTRSFEDKGRAMDQIEEALLAGDYEAVKQYPFIVMSAAELKNSGFNDK
jgi:hypothetical protein